MKIYFNQYKDRILKYAMLVFKMMLMFISPGENSITIVAGNRKVKMLLFNMTSNIISSWTLKVTL